MRFLSFYISLPRRLALFSWLFVRRSFAGFKGEQTQTEAANGEQHTVERCLIRQLPDEQGRPLGLMNDLEIVKPGLPGGVQVSFDADVTSHQR
jgi:hypothetical protein